MDETELRAQLEAAHEDSYGWALACCRGDVAQAEDALQAAYLTILEGRARFQGRSSFKTWLFGVIRNTASAERRKQWWRRLLLLKHVESREEPAQPEEPMVSEEARQWLQQALAGLPERQREALHLVFYQELSLQEAADVMGISIGSARQHYERGKQHLRRALKSTDFHETGLERRRD